MRSSERLATEACVGDASIVPIARAGRALRHEREL
jgi:hypothetical protein